MKNTVSINKYVLVAFIITALAGGAYGGYYYTSQYYKDKEGRKQAS